MTRTIIIAATIIILSACNEKAIDTKAEGEKLMQTSREWSKLAAAGDVEKTLSYWTEDAVLYDVSHPTFKGKAAIRKMVEESMKIPGFKISWEPKEAIISKSGDMGYLHEESVINLADSTGKTITMHFNGVSIWKKQEDGSWKNVVESMVPVASNQ
ncbi:MAG TPA: DUF4440 domain-containing protein [Ferruginibacter sp.]|nr:DUF4440 domain-containing protein [Ferruginibacter sp.]